MVPIEEQHTLLRDLRQGRPERGTGVPSHRQECPRATELHGGPLQRVPRSDKADQHAETQQ